MPKVSIIIPVYNVEKYIARCLNSIVNQTFSDIEIIVVNDATPDSSMKIVKDYAKKDSRIKILANSENCGLLWTRGVGFNAAQGEYIVFCDSDDWLPKDSLAVLYQAITKSGCDIVTGNHEGRADEYTSTFKTNYSLKYGSDKISAFKSLLKLEIPHSMCGKIYKKELFENYDFNLQKKFINSEDAYLFYQLLDRSSKVISIDNIVYYYYANAKSSSRVVLKDRALETMTQACCMIDKIISKYPVLADLKNNYLTHTACVWMLGGSCSYFRTKKALQKYNMQKYLNILYWLFITDHKKNFLKTVIKSFLFSK